MADAINIVIGDASLAALAASPDSGARPGVVILHELFGLTEFIKTRVDWFAARGFAAIAPELYWRIAPGVVYDYAGADFDRAFATRGQLDDDQAVADIGACVARLEIAAAVSFHGVRIETRLEEANRPAAPLLMHFCGLDKYVSQEAVKQIMAALAGGTDVEFHDYPESDHGFSREGQPAYDAAASLRAGQRTLDFLARAFDASG